MAKTKIVGFELTENEYQKKMQETEVDKQELISKLNQVKNFRKLLAHKENKIKEEIESVKTSQLRATETFMKIKFVKEYSNTDLEKQMEKLMKDTGLDKTLEYKPQV